jgi:hypothetical protein
MSVYPDYFISGVLKEKGKITHAVVHRNLPGGFQKGDVKSVVEIIRLLDSKFKILTLTWDYETGKWIDGVVIDMVKIGDEKSLQSFRDNAQSNDLDKLINMSIAINPPAKLPFF